MRNTLRPPRKVTPFISLRGAFARRFSSSAGEIAELKAELQSEKRDRKKEAVKKVIASMTVGKDVR